MKNIVAVILIIFNIQFLVLAQEQSNSPILKGPYLGQPTPGNIPEIFAPGIVSTKRNTDFSSCFSSDGTEFYFSSRKPTGANQLFFSKIVNDKWTEPSLVSFANNYDASEASISPDGKYIFFNSREFKNSSSTVWYSEKINSQWGKPKKLLKDMMFATLSSKNRLYYTDKSGGNISTAKLMSGMFLGGNLTEKREVSIANENGIGNAHPFIASDESYLIYNQIGELYITFSDKDGGWLPSRKLNSEINTHSYEFAPYVTPDGMYFFFTRDDDIYWVDANFINRLKPKN